MTDDDSQNEKPLDPALLRVQARLRGLMLIGLGTLGIGVLAVFVAIAFRLSRAPALPDGTPWQSIIELSTAGKVIATTVSGDQLAVTVESDKGTVIEVHHLPSGRLIGRSVLIAR